MHPAIDDCTGALLAGGRAVRMGGMAKGLLRVGGRPIAARTLELFGRLFAASVVVANDPGPYAGFGAPVVADRVAGKGAPGGLHAALAFAATRWVFAAGCDMPFLSEEAIRFLAARRQGAPAVIVRWRGHLEPLHALWSQECLPVLARLLAAGDPSIKDVADAVGARVIEEEEWRRVDPHGRAFENANTPGDAARLGLELEA